MAVAEWTEAMDEALKRQRLEHKLPWRVVRIEGATVRECQKRLQYLTSGKPAALVKVARAGGPREDEDGLDRLIRRGKLTPLQIEMARRYRRVGRLALSGGGSLRSCLDTSPGGGGSAMPGPGEGFEISAAKREFHTMRWVTLRGQTDVLTALDGVLITGHTLLYLAGGEGKGARAAELLVALTIGLDLLVGAALDGAARAA